MPGRRRRRRRRARGSRCSRQRPGPPAPAHRREHEVRHRREEQRHPDAGEDERDDQRAVRRRGRGRDDGDPAERDRLQRQPDAEDPLRADPSDIAPANGAMNIGASVHGQDPQARAERRVALDGLEELRQQEDRAEHPEEHEQGREVRERERSVAEEAHRQHRCGARSSHATNAATSAKPRPNAVRISGLVQPCSLPRIRPQTIPNMPALTSPTPGRSSLPAGPWLSVSRRARAARARSRSGR